MDQEIATAVTKCIDCFSNILRVPKNLACNSPTFGRDMADQQTRFNVWTGNIGAHRTGPSSLDYRLRDSSNVKDQVLSLLKDLVELMQDAHDILMGIEVPWDQITADEEFDESDDPDTELNQISADVADVVNCLLRLSVTIRNPAPHDRFIKSHSIDTSHYEIFDIQHVSSKFRSIDPLLAERLGKAISRRRQFFNYRLAHCTKLSQGLTHEGGDGETIASSLPEYLKDAASGGQPLPIDAIRGEGSDSGFSQTSYATSLTSVDQCRIPPLPKESSDGPFECPFCYTIIVADTRSSWKKHVYGDLRPYICLEKDCNTPGREFSRRHQWMEHVRQIHWKLYSCPFACDLEFSSPSECIKHVSRSHAGSVNTTDLDALVYLSQKPMDISRGVPCPFCAEMMRSASQYQRHVGRHQEQLALFALPTVESDDKDERGSESDLSEGSVDMISNQDKRGDDTKQPEEPLNSHSIPETGVHTLPPKESNTGGTGRQKEYFLPRDGIAREVIAADICRYLGNDALVRPGHYENPQTGQAVQGYFITAYEDMTTAMIEDLKADSAQWEREKREVSRGIVNCTPDQGTRIMG
ncbi:zinc finger transcription factor ace1 [Fusarium subglutinans]|uniref:Zinc finger transcription factor ace1 n=1 Tax=Gibberella subglutinans TaxID=42677 RepID=A0A8H5PJS7_GIBSU|nr:zinc finger transcription factor ace1 [Fusarium subglutinans]KAF5597623.1 zinc finger transcription factor ace1 [Fusarium subglutinans]